MGAPPKTRMGAPRRKSSPGWDSYTHERWSLFHVQSKATHNSYHERGDVDFLGWNYTMLPLDVQARAQGVRGFELDLQYDGAAGRIDVFHVALVDFLSNCPRFTDCLQALRSFSDAHPNHLPLFIHMEGKGGVTDDNMDALITRAESDVLSVFDRTRIITPDEVQGTFPTLAEAVRTRGWPTLSTTRGRILFAWNETGALRSRYLVNGTSLAGRLFFVESAPADPFAAVAILNDPVGDAPAIAQALAAGMLVRTRADTDGTEPSRGDFTRLEAALATGAHFISTDYPEWDGGQPYAVHMPGGTPSRCNPVTTADAGCTSEQLEVPHGLR